MLTNDDLKRLERLVKLAPYLDREWQEKLLKLVRDLKAAEAQGSGMPQSAVQAMVDAVDDKTMKAIVEEQRRGVPSPSGALATQPSVAPVRGSGWADPPRARDRTNEYRLFDSMVEALAGGPNDCSKIK